MRCAEICRRARNAMFRMPIEPASHAAGWWWGTGFFISPDGYAVTAYHNLPAVVSAQQGGSCNAVLQDGSKISLDYIPGTGDRERDIAFLRTPSRGVDYSCLQAAVLGSGLGERDRIAFWAGRAVIVAGFPFNQNGQTEQMISGHLRGDLPFGIEDEKDADAISVQVERLRITADKKGSLGGISGGPVIDVETGMVVGVQGACHEDERLLFGSELHCHAGCPAEVAALLCTIPAPCDTTPIEIHIDELDRYTAANQERLLAVMRQLLVVSGDIRVLCKRRVRFRSDGAGS